MKNILSGENVEALAPFLRSRALVAFDFDGTLAPVVRDREGARMRRRTRALLESICRLYPSAVISGRGRADLLERVERVPFRHVVGSHGLEAEGGGPPLSDWAPAVRRALDGALAELKGVEIEDKGYTVAIHYRNALNRRIAFRAIEVILARLPAGTRVIRGKLVFDLVNEGMPHKGDAVVHLSRAESVDRIVYVGDDTTDEDVFRLGDSERLLSIRVGHLKSSFANYYVRDQREVDRLLQRMIEAGTKGTAGPSAPGSR